MRIAALSLLLGAAALAAPASAQSFVGGLVVLEYDVLPRGGAEPSQAGGRAATGEPG